MARPDKDEPLYLLTNDLGRPAAEIARLYKERWDIELLFKWIKQNLKIRRFLGRSENAVRIQIYVALIAFMLLRILHHTAARGFKASTALLLTQLKTGPLNRSTSAKPGRPQTALPAATKPANLPRLSMIHPPKSAQQCAKAGMENLRGGCDEPVRWQGGVHLSNHTSSRRQPL